ncbi:hypothetical protein [Marinobacterium sedimentorum]|uniref:hypothetical protein n=1 Tax=Marinobacterium sedimentorum TaxID=2927804 RepID=UPI0020C6AC5D|nr:hypothetical protein [Marinobacterium sedimentorum]MCP8687193.1 hypothetical protein [Marinobacterium sedimentorum]
MFKLRYNLSDAKIDDAGTKALFDGVANQLMRRSYIASGGQIIDATLAPAQAAYSQS